MGKFAEYKLLLGKYGVTLEATHNDLPEIDADPITVVTHKASQLDEYILVDDTSLEVEGAAVGVNVRWLLQNLPDFEGQRAIWTSLIAYHEKDSVLIFRGVTLGVIVKPRGISGFGFDPVFLPEGQLATLAESKPDFINARAKAVDALMEGNVYKKLPVFREWNGKWQH